jgi:hypothetical protein
MTAPVHSRRFDGAPDASGLPQSTDIDAPTSLVRFVPISEVTTLIRSPRQRGQSA